MELKIIPRMSEKTVDQAKFGTYVFNVPNVITKQQIAKAIGEKYGVKVASVNVMVATGKLKRVHRKGGSVTTAKRGDVKKAYVRLVEGDKITVFDQEAPAKEKK